MMQQRRSWSKLPNMLNHGRPGSLAIAFVIATVSAGCAKPDPRPSASPPPSIAMSTAPAEALPPLPSSALPSATPADAPTIAPSAPPAAPHKHACGATHLVVAGEILSRIAVDCYGSRAYDDLLQQKNALKGSTIRVGQSLATPPLRDLARCAPAEVCEPIFAAYAAFIEAQALTEHSQVAPPGAQPHLDAAKRHIEDALRAAEARKITRPKSQLKAAIGEIDGLRVGAGEPGYREHTFHQHLVYAFEALAKGP